MDWPLGPALEDASGKVKLVDFTTLHSEVSTQNIFVLRFLKIIFNQKFPVKRSPSGSSLSLMCCR